MERFCKILPIRTPLGSVDDPAMKRSMYITRYIVAKLLFSAFLMIGIYMTNGHNISNADLMQGQLPPSVYWVDALLSIPYAIVTYTFDVRRAKYLGNDGLLPNIMLLSIGLSVLSSLGLAAGAAIAAIVHPLGYFLSLVSVICGLALTFNQPRTALPSPERKVNLAK